MPERGLRTILRWRMADATAEVGNVVSGGEMKMRIGPSLRNGADQLHSRRGTMLFM